MSENIDVFFLPIPSEWVGGTNTLGQAWLRVNHEIPGFGFVRVGCVRAGEVGGKGLGLFCFFDFWSLFLLFSLEVSTFWSVVVQSSRVIG